MLKCLERAMFSVAERLILLAPPDRAVPDAFSLCEFDGERHSQWLATIQRVRGSIYLQDGAVAPEQLTADGRHQTDEDDRAWHLLMADSAEQVTACAWYRELRGYAQFSRLRLRHCPLASAPEWRDTLWSAVTRDIDSALRDGLHYAEVGGWAVIPERRRSSEPLILALATYALARICGGALTITTATMRHRSCEILGRIGGQPLDLAGVTLPPYYDPRYGCDMRILRFDSRTPHPRYEPIVTLLESKLANVAVVARPYWPMMREPRRAPVSALVSHPQPAFTLGEPAAAVAN